jgi:hypothetical protein
MRTVTTASTGAMTRPSQGLLAPRCLTSTTLPAPTRPYPLPSVLLFRAELSRPSYASNRLDTTRPRSSMASSRLPARLNDTHLHTEKELTARYTNGPVLSPTHAYHPDTLLPRVLAPAETLLEIVRPLFRISLPDYVRLVQLAPWINSPPPRTIPLRWTAPLRHYPQKKNHSSDAKPYQPPVPANLPRPETRDSGRRDPTLHARPAHQGRSRPHRYGYRPSRRQHMGYQRTTLSETITTFAPSPHQ